MQYIVKLGKELLTIEADYGTREAGTLQFYMDGGREFQRLVAEFPATASYWERGAVKLRTGLSRILFGVFR